MEDKFGDYGIISFVILTIEGNSNLFIDTWLTSCRAFSRGVEDFVLDEIVGENEEKFINFYNHAGPISRRYHSLELIPGLGKKTMNQIVRNRPYTGFREMEKKIPNFRHPEKFISQRIENEIKETDQKYRLFVR